MSHKQDQINLFEAYSSINEKLSDDDLDGIRREWEMYTGSLEADISDYTWKTLPKYISGDLVWFGLLSKDKIKDGPKYVGGDLYIRAKYEPLLTQINRSVRIDGEIIFE